MDNVTHTLVGAALAETGLKRWTPLATTTLLLGANFPDIDIVVGLFGSRTYLEHHRGITHAMVAIPFLSALLAGLVYAASQRWKTRRPDHQPARFWPLFWLSLVSMSTHPLLDFTNSYGWRPFLPWDHTWFYGDLDFVVDPWLWAGLGGTLMWGTATSQTKLIRWGLLFAGFAAPVLLFTGITWTLKIIWLAAVTTCFCLRAIIPLTSASTQWMMRGVVVITLCYFGTLAGLQNNSVQRLQATAPQVIRPGEQIVQVDALPLPGDPFRRQGIIATDKAFYFFQWHLLSSEFSQAALSSPRIIQRTSGDEIALKVALHEPEFQAFLRFARFPAFEAVRQPNQTIKVQVRDVRFELDTRAVSTFQTSVLLDAQMRRIME